MQDMSSLSVPIPLPALVRPYLRHDAGGCGIRAADIVGYYFQTHGGRPPGLSDSGCERPVRFAAGAGLDAGKRRVETFAHHAVDAASGARPAPA